MNRAILLAALLIALPVLTSQAQPLPNPVGERVFVLVMDGDDLNYQEERGPLLEAYVGEALSFYVYVPPTAESHTFHLHGHPWWDPAQDRFIDTKILHPGDLHEFSVVAGGEQGHTGDWLYHCHVDMHFEGGMWGILRIHPFSTEVTGTPGQLSVDLHRTGEPVTGAQLSVTLDGTPVPAEVTAHGQGSYTLATPLTGLDPGEELVVTAQDDELGQSVARLQATPGGLEQVRTVGDPAELEELAEGTIDLPDELNPPARSAGDLVG